MSLDLAKCWTEQPWVIVDTESTGVDTRTCGLVEVAAVRVEAGSIVGEFCELVDPGAPIPAEASQVHGIYDAMVAGAPTAELVSPALDDFCAGAVPCAYNAPFDRSLLHRTMPGGSSPVFDRSLSWIDVYVIVASARCDRFVGGKGRLKLSAVCERRGIAHESQHRALGDARATAALLLRLLADTRVRPCPLDTLLRHTDAARAEQQRDFAAWRSRQQHGSIARDGTR